MKNAAQHKLSRLQRLERVRAITMQTAATEAAHAETALAQLSALATRSGGLAADYNRRIDAINGADLRRLAAFASALQGVCRNTQADAVRAQALADRRQGELAEAERRRAAVRDRAVAAGRDIAAGMQAPILNARRKPHG